MLRIFFTLGCAALVALPAPATAKAGAFTLVNGTDADISGVSIRRHGTQDWRSLSAAPRAGARAAIDFDDPDCAFDMRAELAGGKSATWSAVNLCETKSVTLRRDESGSAWVDYD